ncbi:MAG: polysaccharide deacetylase family protein [Candidatus Hodarchaeota archaeon]
MNGAIPVLMYHSVGKTIPGWNWSFLTLPAHLFAEHLRWLRKSDYRTADLAELCAHVSGEVLLPPRSVVITFDDGYLDNWTYAAPLLSHYGFKATVFVNPEFVDPRDIIRPTLEDVWAGRITESELEARGFMSWAELKKINDAGVFSVQSHLMSHTWYPISSEVVDFHHPGDTYYWIDWNAHPEDKPFYLLHPRESKVPFGVPVYRHAKAMESNIFFPDQREALHLGTYVATHGKSNFFRRRDCKKELRNELLKFRHNTETNGREETEEERFVRLNYELTESKRLIEENLNVEVNFLAWPGGGYDDAAMAMAQRIYKAVTLSSRDTSNILNRPRDDPRRIKRIGIPYIEYNRKFYYLGGRYLIRFLDEFRAVKYARQRRQVMKLIFLAAAALGIWPSLNTKDFSAKYGA